MSRIGRKPIQVPKGVTVTVKPDVLEFKDLCEEIFTTEKPMTLIEKHWTMLTNGTGMNADNELSLGIDRIGGEG